MKGTGGTKELQSSIGSLTNKPKCHWMSGVEESPFDRVTKLLGSLRYGHYGLRTTVIHGEDLVRDLLRMLDSTWVSQSVVWLQATGSSRGDSRSEDYVSIFLPIFDQFCFLNATFMLNSL